MKLEEINFYYYKTLYSPQDFLMKSYGNYINLTTNLNIGITNHEIEFNYNEKS